MNNNMIPFCVVKGVTIRYMAGGGWSFWFIIFEHFHRTRAQTPPKIATPVWKVHKVYHAHQTMTILTKFL